MSLSSCSFSEDDPGKAAKAMRDMFGPQAVDNAIRQAISTCWVVMPESKKNVESVEAEIRRIVDRALASLKEDARAFGIERD